MSPTDELDAPGVATSPKARHSFGCGLSMSKTHVASRSATERTAHVENARARLPQRRGGGGQSCAGFDLKNHVYGAAQVP